MNTREDMQNLAKELRSDLTEDGVPLVVVVVGEQDGKPSVVVATNAHACDMGIIADDVVKEVIPWVKK